MDDLASISDDVTYELRQSRYGNFLTGTDVDDFG